MLVLSYYKEITTLYILLRPHNNVHIKVQAGVKIYLKKIGSFSFCTHILLQFPLTAALSLSLTITTSYYSIFFQALETLITMGLSTALTLPYSGKYPTLIQGSD